ncbi:hypothetical protein [Aphanizomenon sp. UHCC 0183]|uniref:type IV pilus modification PilV family protein n=1 Tax=Aphanizomenon sp. UHCC 0183 TaxID=2590028 RepID=UPI0014472470|nr:hypothetical protein [Aphanizomenon sp. UHCC 0183]MTJ31959.1 hypothetical protein [Aphanizomenon sp. UHCC 0183]
MKNLKDNPDAGFSLIEVVVALLMIFFFTTGALEMFVLSSIFKKKAIQYTTANSLIQQDMEKIKSAADQYSFPKATTAAALNTNTVTLDSTNGLAASTVLFSNDADANNYTTTISGNTITVTPALKTEVPVSTSVFNLTSCNLTSSGSASNGMATYFMNSLSTTATGIDNSPNSDYKTSDGTAYYVVTSATKQVKGQYYWLLRKQDVSTDAPYNILKLNYLVQIGTSSTPNIQTTPTPPYPRTLLPAYTVAKSYTEVIPYASLQCPSQ